MSTKRPSAGVQTLRAMFENDTDSPSQAPQARQSNGDRLSMTEPQQPLTKVRSSFISVDQEHDKSEDGDHALAADHNTPQPTVTAGTVSPEQSQVQAHGNDGLGATPTQTPNSSGSSPSNLEMNNPSVVNGTADKVNGSIDVSVDDATRKTEIEVPPSESNLVPGDMNTPSSYAPELVTLPDHDVPAQVPDKSITGADTEPETATESDPKTDMAASPIRPHEPAPTAVSVTAQGGDTSPAKDMAPSTQDQETLGKSTVYTPSVKKGPTSAKPLSQTKSRLSLGTAKATPSKDSLHSPTAARALTASKTSHQVKPSASTPRAATDPEAATSDSTPSRKIASAAPRQSLTAPTAASSAKTRHASVELGTKSTERKRHVFGTEYTYIMLTQAIAAPSPRLSQAPDPRVNS